MPVAKVKAPFSLEATRVHLSTRSISSDLLLSLTVLQKTIPSRLGPPTAAVLSHPLLSSILSSCGYTTYFRTCNTCTTTRPHIAETFRLNWPVSGLSSVALDSGQSFILALLCRSPYAHRHSHNVEHYVFIVLPRRDWVIFSK
jgi:hypothetical protein